jgi:NADPH-ferrihemoprotein reductase
MEISLARRWAKPSAVPDCDPQNTTIFLPDGGQAGSANKETRNIAQKLEETGKNIVVFWGSQC